MSTFLEGRVVNLERWTKRLHSLRVEAPVEPFKAGQFGRLGLEIVGEMVFRPYSFGSAPHERPPRRARSCTERALRAPSFSSDTEIR
jgi:ferredoxin--NADP+ reductase